MTVFLAGFANINSGKCPPVALDRGQVIDYFFAKGDLKAAEEAEITRFLNTAQIGDWQEFEGFGIDKATTLTLVAIRSSKPGAVQLTNYCTDAKMNSDIAG